MTGTSASKWFRDQLQTPASLLLPAVTAQRQALDDDRPELDFFLFESTTHSFWANAIAGPDQLRQRMAWALSQILVVSNGGGELLSDLPEAVAYFEDKLIEGAFGNFRDLLTEVTYAPAMGHYLTYLGSEKANPETGRMPDENYARELLQLFTIGVVELSMNGETISRNGRTETYDNRDVTGLARVFTGLVLEQAASEEEELELEMQFSRRLIFNPDAHSSREKSFLGTTIAADTSGADSVRLALDAVFAHPNVAPFIGRQLIQRFITSAPEPAYVERVARTFEAGSYTLPDGTTVGDGRRGDLTATLAAVLFDDEARSETNLTSERFGKIREPILRVTAWARAFGVGEITPQYLERLNETSSPTALQQHPYRAPSVFNFYRPGYIAPGTLTGQAGLTAPELQLVNASTVPGYANFLYEIIARNEESFDEETLDELEGLGFDRNEVQRSFIPDYHDERALAGDPPRLVDHLDARLSYGTMSSETRARIAATIANLDEEDPETRVHMAIWMVMTSPDFLVQH